MPKGYRKEFDYIFIEEWKVNLSADLLSHSDGEGSDDDDTPALHAIPISAEKDRLLEVLRAFATQLHERLTREGYWLDYIDPCR